MACALLCNGSCKQNRWRYGTKVKRSSREMSQLAKSSYHFWISHDKIAARSKYMPVRSGGTDDSNMKKYKQAIGVAVVMVVLTLAAVYSNMTPKTDEQIARGGVAGGGVALGELPSSSAVQSSGGGSAPGGSTSSTSGAGSAVATLGNDWSEVSALSSKSLDWGPGGPVDSQNRSQGALSYEGKYGKYGARFIGPEQKTVYLTFDEGYEYGLTGSVLDTLKEKGVKATFFITYDFANRSGELVRRMIDEGHIVGNHSYSHKNYSTLTPKQMADDLMKMHDFIKETFDYEMCYFRFPSGNFNEQGLAVVQKMGYKTLFWSFAYKDWIVDSQPEPSESLKRVVEAVCPGNIYLLHAVSATNNTILGDVIDRIRELGYEWGDPATL